MTQVEDTWKLIHWENWKINCGIGKRKNPDIQTGLTGTQVCACSFCKAFMFAPWQEGGTARTHCQVESHDGARGVKVLNKVSNFVESKWRACCIIIAFFFFCKPALSFTLQTALSKNITWGTWRLRLDVLFNTQPWVGYHTFCSDDLSVLEPF